MTLNVSELNKTTVFVDVIDGSGNDAFRLLTLGRYFYVCYNNVIEHSASLHCYSFLIAEVENNISKGLTRDESIKKAINTCIEKGILSDFLKDNFVGVVNMLTFEYDQDAERRVLRQEAREEGIHVGERNIIIQMITKGKSIEEISALTGMPINEIQQLINYVS